MVYVPYPVSDEELEMLLAKRPEDIGPGMYALARSLREARDAAKPKVEGYTAQPDAKVALVNGFKQDEERLLRKIDVLDAQIIGYKMPQGAGFDPGVLIMSGYRNLQGAPYDPYWLAAARKHFLEGFMALNRAVFQPQRIKLPEDGE